MQPQHAPSDSDKSQTTQIDIAPSPVDLVGQSIAGRYRLLRRLGQGGMGVVYEAFDSELERRLAIKVIAAPKKEVGSQSHASADSPDARLIAEAQAQAKLLHPNVVAVYDVGQSDHGVYLAMELVQGQTVREWLQSATRPWRQVVAIFLQAASGLGSAHDAGLIHRDFKPDNLLLGDDGRVRVADFGLATRDVPTTQRSRGLSHTGQTTRLDFDIAGTPSYMAPEQHRGSGVTAKSDQYAFCVSLYEALYRVRPFAGDTMQELQEAIAQRNFSTRHRHTKVPSWLRAIVERGLAADPDDRFDNLHTLQTILQEGYERRSGRYVAGGALMCGLLAVALSSLQAHFEVMQQCQSKAERAREIWSPATWQVVDAAFNRSDLAFAQDALESARRQIESRVEGWSEVYGSLCRDRRGMIIVADATEECLEDQRQELQTLATLYSKPSAREVESAAQVTAKLPYADVCLKRVATTARRDQPSDPAALSDYLTAQRELQSLTVLRQVGIAETYWVALERALPRIEASHAPELIMRAVSPLAHAYFERQEFHGATKLSNRAILLAEAAHDPIMSSSILGEQTYLRNYKMRGDYDAAQDLYRLTMAHLSRADNDPLTRAQVCMDIVPYLSTIDKNRQAEACLRNTIAVLSNHYGERHIALQRALEYLAITLANRNASADPEQEALLLRGRDILVQNSGPHHPALGLTYFILSNYSRQIGDVVQAVRYLEEVHALVNAGPTDVLLPYAMQIPRSMHAKTQGEWHKLARICSECQTLVASNRDSRHDGLRLTCLVGETWVRARFNDYSQCGRASELLPRLVEVQVGSYFGPPVKCDAMLTLEEIAVMCGDLAQAQRIEDQRQLCEKAFRDPKQPLVETIPIDLLERTDKLVPGLASINLQTIDRDPNGLDANRLEVLLQREVWARALLQVGQPTKAVRILENDMPLRRRLVGDGVVQTWRADLWRAWGYLQVGRAHEAVSLLEPIAHDLPTAERDVLHGAYLWALLARAHAAIDSHHPQVSNELAQAKHFITKLRQPPPALLNLVGGPIAQ